MHWLGQRALSSGAFTVLASALFAAAALPASESESREAGDGLTFSVRFWAEEIELSGVVRNQETVDALLAEVRRARPSSEIWDVDLEIDERAASLPPMDELSGLLMELALSTQGGILRIAENSIMVSGLTDSLVTHAAFEARLQELAGGRFVAARNEIQIVPTARFKLPPERRPRMPLEPQPLEFRPYEVSDEPYGPPVEMLRAEPIGQADGLVAEVEAVENESIAATASEEPSPSLKDLEVRFGPLAPVRFEANRFLVEFKQQDAVREAADLIKALPLTSGKVTLRGSPDATGQGSYHQWLALARAKEVQKLLVSFGVAEERLAVEGTTSGSLHQVLIVVPSR